jgi:sugar (pentulose or hexulose) kinase
MNDGLAAVIGAGLTDPGLGVDVGGTAGGVAVAATPSEAARITTTLPGRLWSGPAPAPFGDGVILGGAFAGTGRLLEWVVTELLANDPAAAPARRAELFHAAAALPLGAEGLMAKPISHLGWSSPRSVDDAFVGRTDQHSAAHLVRAAIESGALAVAHLLAPAIKAGLQISEMRLSGPATGAAPGPLSGREPVPAPLIQLRADLFGMPVVIGQNPEASAAGAAALAGVAAGSFANLREASQAVATSAQRVEPDRRAQDRARELLQKHGELSTAAGESGAGRRED